jgi:hypothetical protein
MSNYSVKSLRLQFSITLITKIPIFAPFIIGERDVPELERE